MENKSLSAREVVTFPEGTMAIMRGLSDQDHAMAVIFFDKNRNGALDTNDQKILIDALDCPKGGRQINDKGGRSFCVVRVEKSDISYYGPSVTSIWKKAWAERALLPQIVKPQSEGICTIDAEKVEEPLYSASLQVRFEPQFTLKTRTAPASERYTAAQMRKIFQDADGTPAVDPARCYETEASFKARLDGQDVGIRLYITGRPFAFVPLYVGINEILNLRYQPYLPHISYEDGSTPVHHLNVNVK